MTPYEILLMLDPELPEERQNEIVTRTRELIERGGGAWDAGVMRHLAVRRSEHRPAGTVASPREDRQDAPEPEPVAAEEE